MAKKSINDISISLYDDLLGIDSETERNQYIDSIVELSIDEIEDFPNHPFKVRLDEDMSKMVESIQENGILVATLVRPNPDGIGYQMIATTDIN